MTVICDESRKLRIYYLLQEKWCFRYDKNQSEYIDMVSRKVKIYPDTPESICEYINKTSLKNLKVIETEFAFIIVATNSISNCSE